MKKVLSVAVIVFFCLLSANLHAAEKDADGCKDHPLIPRMQGHYIAECTAGDATLDFGQVNVKNTEIVYLVGKAVILLYSPQPDLKSKLSEIQLRRDFEDGVKKQGGAFMGVTISRNQPIYKITKNGKNIWVVLMHDSGEYFTGSYEVGIVEP